MHGQAPPYVLLRRRWLIFVLALLLLPWLIAGVYVWSLRDSPEQANAEVPTQGASDSQALARTGKVGPWGQLQYTPILISPPLEFVPDARGPMQENRVWFFNSVTPDQLSQFLLESALPPPDVARLMSTARLVPGIQGVSVVPPDDLILGLPSTTRERLYVRLAECEFNVPQRDAFRFYGDSFEDWMGTSRLPREIQALVKPLIYSHDSFMYFADIDLVTPRIPDRSLLRRLNKALCRESTFLIQLRIPESAEIDRVAEYWGTGGRRMDVRPLLESLGPRDSVDINLLLPIFARRRAYTYRPVTAGDFEKLQQVNCFWTALNFFNDPPDDGLLDYKNVLATLKRDYKMVHENFQLGDIVVFADENGNYYHAAVYIAEDIVFTKNGDSILSPFVLVPLSRIKNYYLGVRTKETYYYRLNRLS